MLGRGMQSALHLKAVSGKQRAEQPTAMAAKCWKELQLLVAVLLCSTCAVVNGDATAVVRNGKELVEVFASAEVTVAIISNDVHVSESDFSGVIVVRRNLLITGEGSTIRPILSMNLGGKGFVRLADGVTLSVRGILFTQNRRGLGALSPGLDMLTNVEGNETAYVDVNGCALVHGVCLPRPLQVATLSNFTRPLMFPGPQQVGVVLPQPNCTNSSSAHLLGRCWARRGLYVDLALPGMDADETARLRPSGYIIHTVNTEFLCALVMTEECVQNLGAIGCSLYLMPPTTLAASSTGGAGGDSGMDTATTLAVVLSCVLGGLALAAGIGGFAVWWRWGRRRRSAADGHGKTDSAPSGLPHSSAARGSSAKGAASACGAAIASFGSPSPGNACDGQQHSNLAGNGDGMGNGGGGGAAAASGAKLPISQGSLTSLKPEQHPSVNLQLSAHSHSNPSCAPAASSEGARGHSGGAAAAESSELGDGPGTMTSAPATTASAVASGASAGSGSAAVTAVTLSGVTLAPSGMPVVVTPFTPHRADLKLDLQCDTEVELLPVVRGQGNFGRVVEGMYAGQRVAVKLLRDVSEWSGAPKNALQSFKQEVEVLGRCQHPNVVRLLAACTQPPRFCLVMELMETSLDRVVHNAKKELLPLAKVLHIGVEIARALEYLHPTIVHRDLKPGNVLLNNPGSARPEVKLTDFGLSRLRSTVQITRHPEAGTPSYMAPELFDIHNSVVTDKSDVYALGVLLWELLSGLVPWTGCDALVVAYAITIQRTRLSLAAIKPERSPPKLAKLITSCWEHDPLRRPAAGEIVKQLLLVQQELQRQTAARQASETSGMSGDGKSRITSADGGVKVAVKASAAAAAWTGAFTGAGPAVRAAAASAVAAVAAEPCAAAANAGTAVAPVQQQQRQG